MHRALTTILSNFFQVTEGMREVGKTDPVDPEGEEEEDFMDEYGNIKPVGLRTNKKVIFINTFLGDLMIFFSRLKV